MVIKQCICGGFYRTNSWIHKLYKALKRRATDEELLRFQNNLVDEEDLIDETNSTVSTSTPKSEKSCISN